MPKLKSPREFMISAASLQALFAGLNLPLKHSGWILFAIRGALPVKSLGGWVRETALRPVRVDYRHMRCTLGIWNRAEGKVFVAPGSTVPQKANVLRAADRRGKLQGKGTNQLETGFYSDLTKGEHLQGKANGHQALRQTAGRFYRRSLTGVPYTRAAPLFYGNPYDNLHCAWNPNVEDVGYSSSGCLVVAGLPHCPRREDAVENQGPWKIFHDFLYGTPQRNFPILLVTAELARKAWLESGISAGRTRLSSNRSVTSAAATSEGRNGESGFPKGWDFQKLNLVFGSEGGEVRILQRYLAAHGFYRGRAHGRLDVRTYRAWNRALNRTK